MFTARLGRLDVDERLRGSPPRSRPGSGGGGADCSGIGTNAVGAGGEGCTTGGGCWIGVTTGAGFGDRTGSCGGAGSRIGGSATGRAAVGDAAVGITNTPEAVVFCSEVCSTTRGLCARPLPLLWGAFALRSMITDGSRSSFSTTSPNWSEGTVLASVLVVDAFSARSS